MIVNLETGEDSHGKAYSVRLHCQIPPYHPDLHRPRKEHPGWPHVILPLLTLLSLFPACLFPHILIHLTNY